MVLGSPASEPSPHLKSTLGALTAILLDAFDEPQRKKTVAVQKTVRAIINVMTCHGFINSLVLRFYRKLRSMC